MQVACQMVHWIQQELIKRSMDGEVRANKNEGGSADHAKGHDEISHDEEMVSSEVDEERGGDKEVHEVRESDERAHGVRAGCDGVCKAKESNDGPLKGGEDGNSVCEARESDNKVKESDNKVKESGNEMKESSNKAKESSNKACERRVMGNGDDIHMKMASRDRKGGKDEVNEGE